MNTLSLVADIGGTNARFTLSDGQILKQIHTLACEDFSHIQEAIKHFFTLCQLNIGDVQYGCIAIANPITGDHIKMTNHHWSFSISELEKSLQLKKLLVINDFTAQALSILRLKNDDFLEIKSGKVVQDSPIAVIGPGTGLGVSGLIPLGKYWHALSSEGGHVSFSPRDNLETSIWQYARNIYGHVSAERLICGSGLSLIDAALSKSSLAPEMWRRPAEITEAANAGEKQAEQVIILFNTFLATVASNLVLTLGARGGVYLCGGILPRITHHLTKDNTFVQRFADKGRFSEYLQHIPVRLVIAENPGLQGAAEALQQSFHI